MTGSHLVSGSEAVHVFRTGLFAVLTLMSWALRPGDRVLGAGPERADEVARRDGGTVSLLRSVP
ncbi:hypothetical protein [Glycomyces tenuis]|uniref:hypothetical protein n=1 Tax=Glycomyces tenuis TaxID=58116 RepID=UPI000550915C|nr:hypothetical protein [Glycomyces tenuis]